MTGAMTNAAGGTDNTAGRRAVRGAVLRRPAAVPDHARAQPRRRPLRAARPPEVLRRRRTMALITPPPPARTARDVVAASLTQPRPRRQGPRPARRCCCSPPASTMLMLFVLLAADRHRGAGPVFQEQGFDFITGTIGSEPGHASGIWPGLYGSFFIGLGVRDRRDPARHRGGDLPRGVRRRPQPLDPARSWSTSATWPACRPSSTASSA